MRNIFEENDVISVSFFTCLILVFPWCKAISNTHINILYLLHRLKYVIFNMMVLGSYMQGVTSMGRFGSISFLLFSSLHVSNL